MKEVCVWYEEMLLTSPQEEINRASLWDLCFWIRDG